MRLGRTTLFAVPHLHMAQSAKSVFIFFFWPCTALREFPTAVCPHYHNNATEPAVRHNLDSTTSHQWRHHRATRPIILTIWRNLSPLIAAYLISKSHCHLTLSAETSIRRLSDSLYRESHDSDGIAGPASPKEYTDVPQVTRCEINAKVASRHRTQDHFFVTFKYLSLQGCKTRVRLYGNHHHHITCT
ncbi:uncharacterized protein HD556DRAFT_256185 [Suillus plorans]|uniref:Uncharacterized protein n=1 Tax=Suillus plorans TaxID=116603 RepID=A0A9P7DL03_9AGAM|nr:uncharacterized protein HD556DRAFT_256185 [Suillus plorans]KAG1797434.1 hypothetical protein HD556DRAFT_256185 [Suillus plorans]